jgi:hypothetical protein
VPACVELSGRGLAREALDSALLLR